MNATICHALCSVSLSVLACECVCALKREGDIVEISVGASEL